MEQYKQDFIKFMVGAGVLTFGDFVTNSGRKTPYFINTGNYESGDHLTSLASSYVNCIDCNFDRREYNILFGPAYKGIPLALAVSQYLFILKAIDVFYSFNRKEVKDHGDKKNIIGHSIKNGDKILIVEDVTTSGKTIRESVELLTKLKQEITITGAVISVDRLEYGVDKTKTALQELEDDIGIKVCSIVNIYEIVSYLRYNKIDGKYLINDELFAKIKDYWGQYCPQMPFYMDV